jgi:hypothetical protein
VVPEACGRESGTSSGTSKNTEGNSRRYDDRSAREPSYPSQTPSAGDYVSYDDHESSCCAEDEGYSSDIEVLHAPPGFVAPVHRLIAHTF